MHSSLTWRWWSQNIELFIRFMTISWTTQPNRFQRPQRQLRYTLHASAQVPVVMRMKTTKTPSLIEYSAIPTSARRKTTTKFIYFVFLLTWTRIRNYEPSILAYDGWTEIVHAFDRTFNVGFLRTRKHTFTGMRSREKKSNIIFRIISTVNIYAQLNGWVGVESHRCSWCS